MTYRCSLTAADSTHRKRYERSSQKCDDPNLTSTALTSDEPDVAGIVAVFDEHAVAFVVVGGVAAREWGATRATKDLDTVVATEGVNLARVAEALTEIGARLRVDGLSDDEARALSMPITGDWLSRLEISTWQTDLGAVDVLAHIPDLDGTRLDYQTLAARAKQIDVDGITVLIASLHDIVASKRWANRPKDRDALHELEQLADQIEHDNTPDTDLN